MYKAVIFDIGNVLMNWQRDTVYADLQQEFGFDEAQIKEFFEKYVNKLGLGEISEEQLWTEARMDLGIRPVDPAENLLGRVFEAQGIVFQNVLDDAVRLKARGFKVALLSNTIAAHAEVFAEKGVTAPFDYVFLSHKIGLRKPDPKIYQYALDKIGVVAAETIFIDDLDENIAAAKKMGIQTIHATDPELVPEQIEAVLVGDFVGTKVALITDDSVIVILRDNKPDISYPNQWDFPGGAREPKETPFEVGIREIQEELGITVANANFIYQKFYPGVIDQRRTASFLVSKISDAQVADIVFGDEGQEWKLMTFQEFLDHPNVIEGMKQRLRDYLESRSK